MLPYSLFPSCSCSSEKSAHIEREKECQTQQRVHKETGPIGPKERTWKKRALPESCVSVAMWFYERLPSLVRLSLSSSPSNSILTLFFFPTPVGKPRWGRVMRKSERWRVHCCLHRQWGGRNREEEEEDKEGKRGAKRESERYPKWEID